MEDPKWFVRFELSQGVESLFKISLGIKPHAKYGMTSWAKTRVPVTFQLGAISPCSAFLACGKINNLRVFNTPEYSNSPRLHS
jgi:hypothetical protein